MDVPELIADGQSYKTDEEKANILMDTFFPTPPTPKGYDPNPSTGKNKKQDIEWLPLIKGEVKRVIFKSNPDKALGPDEISFRVWREL
jgi:hypothetical protein